MRFGFLLALVATLAVPTVALASTDPRLLNLEEMVTADDYPAIAAKNGQEGTVVVAVRVSRDGLVESCKIKKSSGHVALDEQSCAVFRARARFEPARDSTGRAIAGTYERPMTWRLEGTAPPTLPRQAWMIRATLFVAEDKIVDCKEDGIGIAQFPPICPPKPDAAEKPADLIIGELITTNQFVPVPYAKAKIPPDAADATRIGQQVSEIIIEADGIVSRCVGMRYAGQARPDGDFCTVVNGYRFDPIAPGSPALTGTLVTTGYIKKRSVT